LLLSGIWFWFLPWSQLEKGAKSTHMDVSDDRKPRTAAEMTSEADEFRELMRGAAAAS